MADERERFSALAGKPYLWQQTAREFVVAANYLLDWYDVSRATPAAAAFEFSLGGNSPAMVLYAIAVENLLKAIRVARDGSPVVGGVLSKHFKHHDLVSHAEQARVALTDTETEILKQLGDFSEAGRYPVAAAAGKTPRAWRFDFPRDVRRIWALLERLEKELRATTQHVLPRTNLRKRYRPPGYALPKVARRRPTRS